MNRKIFTLLAVVLMLFTTAFYANAWIVADKSVGARVKSLADSPDRTNRGMYHILVDSICIADSNGDLYWVPVTYDGDVTAAGSGGASNPAGISYGDGFFNFQGQPGMMFGFSSPGNAAHRDTLVLAAMESGEVIMISAKDLRLNLIAEKAKLIDLQSTMWCIDVEEKAQYGQWPTFHFTNKVFNCDLDYSKPGQTYVTGRDKGWMYSQAYKNGQLSFKQPFYRHLDNSNGEYRVLIAQSGNGSYTYGSFTGKIYAEDVPISDFVEGMMIPGMLKFTIVKVQPFVLDAENFNGILGSSDPEVPVKLKFKKTATITNPFEYALLTEESNNPDAAALGYLNVQAFNNAGASLGYIANYNGPKEKNSKYNNAIAYEYLNLHTVKNHAMVDDRATGDNDYNFSYRFVYFPSEDSLVINAYNASHDRHSKHGSANFFDDHPTDPYLPDPGDKEYYYGLYNDNIHEHLIVILQDLSNQSTTSLMTIERHPGNTHISFGVNNCAENILDAWQPQPGIYTIWDTKGRCLGVRMYNGTYTPQWLELEDDKECPDRIPSYQWVVEISNDGQSLYRVDITNREFGDLSDESSEFVAIKNVIVRRMATQIFINKSQFLYPWLWVGAQPGGTYEPINYGYVEGKYLPVITNPSDCGTGGYLYSLNPGSGFRPVVNDYVTVPTLGYKHFYVGTDASKPDFGKSEDVGASKGMDYNAFAFNYLSGWGEDGYISLGKSPYNDETLLQVKRGKSNWTGFQFRLAKYLRDHKNVEEPFGYPRVTFGPNEIKDKVTGVLHYSQKAAPPLKRYYYEFKVADYYTYRDGLAEQFVVLKGAKEDNTDINNAMKYGVDDIWGEIHPFKFANVYLRETYFIKDSYFKTPKVGDERAPQDSTRSIWYALLDRIEREQVKKVTSFGLEISDTLRSKDGSHPYNLVTLDVDYSTLYIKARGKTGSAVNVATFMLENVNYPLYRRLRSARDDNALPGGDGVDPVTGAILETNYDAPKVLRMYSQANGLDYLFEDGLSSSAANYGINFLGLNNINQYPDQYLADGITVRYNYNLFIDTAFINRGTGPIKPQYLIAVGAKQMGGLTLTTDDGCGNYEDTDLEPYVIGRYLVNATDSARILGSDGRPKVQIRDERFIWDTDWDRLVFVEAIHIHDRLYIVSELKKAGLKVSDYCIQDLEGEWYVDGRALKAHVASGKLKERKWDNQHMYGAYYDFGVWDNYHNDVCFSLRFRQPFVQNPDKFGVDAPGIYEADKRFLIESETTNRTPYGNRKIAPVQGGWVAAQNRVPVLSRGSYSDAIQNAMVFNIDNRVDWQDGIATGNESVAKVTVVAGEGFVTIGNAAGKQVTIANMLGQTVVNKVLAGNNEAVAVAKGVAVVSVAGEKAVKVIIK